MIMENSRPKKELRRYGIQRLSRERWATGQSVWEADHPGIPVTVDQLTVSREKASVDIAKRLGITPGDHVCRRSRRYSVDGAPVKLAVSYLPYAIVGGSRIMEVDTGGGGIYARLIVLGHEPVEFCEEVRGREPSPDEVKRFGFEKLPFVLAITRTAFTAHERPVEVTEMVVNAEAYVLDYTFRA